MIFEFIRRWTLRDGNDIVQSYGSAHEAQEPATVTGTPRMGPRTQTLAAGASVKLWDYTADGAFAEMIIEGSGVFYIAQKVDAPVSSSDATAAGTSVNYAKDCGSCNMPFTIQGMTIPVNVSASNYAASAFHAATTAGRRYEIWVKNPSATDSITITDMRTL